MQYMNALKTTFKKISLKINHEIIADIVIKLTVLIEIFALKINKNFIFTLN
jgi:hypothetical protein